MARPLVYPPGHWNQLCRDRRHSIKTQILQYAAEGHTDPEIASLMNYSLDNIKGHWWPEIRRQLQARNRTHAAAIAIREGII